MCFRRYNYQMFCILVHDEFGRGRFVQHSVIDSNNEIAIEKAMHFFKKANSSWDQVKCVVVDKDLKEVKIIKRLLPNAEVVLCGNECFFCVSVLSHSTPQAAIYDTRQRHTAHEKDKKDEHIIY